MEGRAFRHGDIVCYFHDSSFIPTRLSYQQEDVLADLLKRSAGGFALGAIIGKGGTKFNGLDVKRVYFG